MSYKIAMYLRLSDEDENNEESTSIIAQRELIHDYIRNNEELSMYEVLEFSDDGYSGTNFNRPGVTEMLLEAKKGEINCIIVKDFSRFGRNYIEVGSYLDEVFPFLGIRFISINDNFDSKKAVWKSEFISMAFKNLIYDLYSRDLSQKITSVRRTKAEQGKFITGFAPYGYQKTKEQKLVVDYETAPIVKRIFDLALEGMPKVQIARNLNQEKIPSPLALRKIRKENFSCSCVNEMPLWCTSTISNILKDQRYVGDGVYGKVKSKQNGKDKRVAKKNWIIVPNVHEAIIDREIFEMINSMFRTNTIGERKQQFALSKKVRCGACNHMISRKKIYKEGETPVATYRCATLHVTNDFGCFGEKIYEKEIEDAILLYLNGLMKILNDDSFIGLSIETLQKKIKKSEYLIKYYEANLKKASLDKLRFYELYKKDRMTKRDFLNSKVKIDNQMKQTNALLDLEEKNLSKLCDALKTKSNTNGLPNKNLAFDQLSKEIVEDFVDAVIIEKNGFIKIIWKFEDLFLDNITKKKPD